MDQLDAAALGQLALKLGLITEEQLAEAQEEAGPRNPDPLPLLRHLERKTYLTPWQTTKLVKGDTDGYVLGGYRLLYRVAAGSFGRVYRADDPRTGRIVAIKVLRRRWSEDQQRIDLFAREARVGMSLKHPNIVDILAMNHDPLSGQYYIAMEFVEGGNLREILQIRKKLAVPEALSLIEDAASGLAYAYSRGVTHRDVKLTNLLISSQGTAKLVDFGLAQFYAAAVEAEGKGKVQEKMERTVDYAGLEKATNVKPGDVRSDIYFLGCVLYEALTGRSPLLMTRDRHARMRKSRFDNVPPMGRDEVDAPPSVFQLVDTMMSLAPLRRYQTPAQLLDAIKAVRREVGGGASGAAGRKGPRSLFIVERDERLQDAMREKFKELGYRVFMAGDPGRALDRFRQQPYDALIVDAGTVGEEGVSIFEHIQTEAAFKRLTCAGVLILSEPQAGWSDLVKPRPTASVLVRPVTLKQLWRKLQEMLPQ
jgi:CheY-like chemotaxis protein